MLEWFSVWPAPDSVCFPQNLNFLSLWVPWVCGQEYSLHLAGLWGS